MLVLVLPEYISLAAEGVGTGEIDPRSILREIKLLQKIATSGICRRALQIISTDPQTLIPWQYLKSSPSEIIRKFAQRSDSSAETQVESAMD